MKIGGCHFVVVMREIWGGLSYVTALLQDGLANERGAHETVRETMLTCSLAQPNYKHGPDLIFPMSTLSDSPLAPNEDSSHPPRPRPESSSLQTSESQLRKQMRGYDPYTLCVRDSHVLLRYVLRNEAVCKSGVSYLIATMWLTFAKQFGNLGG